MRLAEVQGRSFEPDGFVLGDGLSVANYAKALSIDEPLYRSADEARVAGWPGRPVPPGMLAFFLAFPDPGVWDELGVTWGRTLAGTIEIEAARLAGEEEFVEGRAHVEAVWERPGRDGDARQFLRLRSDFTDEKGEFVGRWRVTFVERAGGPPSGSVPQEDPGGGGEELPLERLAPRSAPPAGAQAGTDLPAHRTAPLDRLAFARMSVALDDPNLVHLDEAVAAAAGFPSVIGSGGFVVGALAEVVRRWAGVDRVVRGTTRQLQPLWPGTALTARGSVTALERRSDRPVAVCTTELVDQTGQRIAEGTFDALLED